VEAEFFHSEVQTGTMELVVTSRNFAKASTRLSG
jgi:hypothetical protein